MPWQTFQTSEHGVTKYWVDKAERIETIYESKNVNGWNVIFEANEYGKIEIIGRKTLGKLGKGLNQGEESQITLNLQTTDNRAPKFNVVSIDYTKYVELEDHKKRTTASFDDSRHRHMRKYKDGSILTVHEFIAEIIPAFEPLLNDTNTHIEKISDQVSKLQHPHDLNYTKIIN